LCGGGHAALYRQTFRRDLPPPPEPSRPLYRRLFGTWVKA
jgi:hypothetical protein